MLKKVGFSLNRYHYYAPVAESLENETVVVFLLSKYQRQALKVLIYVKR